MGNLVSKRDKFCALGIGDCGTTASSKFSSFNQDVTNVLVQNIQRCGTQVSQSQTLDVSGSYNVLSNIVMKQAIQFQINCPQLANNIADIQSQIEAKITEKAQATGQMISLNSTSSSVDGNITTQVQKNINMENINEIMTTVNMQQGLDVSGNHNIIENVTMDQTSGMIAQAAQTVLNKIDSFAKLDSSGNGDSGAETKNILSFLTDWLSSATGLIVAGLVVAAYFGYNMFFGSDSSYEMPQMPPPQYPQYPPQYPPQMPQAPPVPQIPPALAGMQA